MTRKPNENEGMASASAPVRRRFEARRTKPAAAPPQTPAVERTDTPTTPVAPARHEIAALAYSYWVARGYQGGSPEEDWLRAERELTVAVHAA
jgi:hypothetical protein